MSQKRERPRRKGIEKCCPACSLKMTLNLKRGVRKIEVVCTRCTTRFWLTFQEDIPKIQRDFEAGNNYYGQED